MIRELVAKFTNVMTQRRCPRKPCQVPVKVWFEPEANTLFKSPNRDLFISGETVDISESGIAFLVSSIRIKEDYLVGQHRLLNVEFDIPGRKVRMQVAGRRYEKVGIHLSSEKYLIGAEIVKMDDENRRAYEYLLRHGQKISKMIATGIEAEV